MVSPLIRAMRRGTRELADDPPPPRAPVPKDAPPEPPVNLSPEELEYRYAEYSGIQRDLARAADQGNWLEYEANAYFPDTDTDVLTFNPSGTYFVGESWLDKGYLDPKQTARIKSYLQRVLKIASDQKLSPDEVWARSTEGLERAGVDIIAGVSTHAIDGKPRLVVSIPGGWPDWDQLKNTGSYVPPQIMPASVDIEKAMPADVALVQTDALSPGMTGRWNRQTRTLTVSDKFEQNIATLQSYVHEMEHAIQSDSGLPRGGNYTEFLPQNWTTAMSEMQSHTRKWTKLEDVLDEFDSILQQRGYSIKNIGDVKAKLEEDESLGILSHWESSRKLRAATYELINEQLAGEQSFINNKNPILKGLLDDMTGLTDEEVFVIVDADGSEILGPLLNLTREELANSPAIANLFQLMDFGMQMDQLRNEAIKKYGSLYGEIEARAAEALFGNVTMHLKGLIDEGALRNQAEIEKAALALVRWHDLGKVLGREAQLTGAPPLARVGDDKIPESEQVIDRKSLDKIVKKLTAYAVAAGVFPALQEGGDNE